jgi:hypothetical protein
MQEGSDALDARRQRAAKNQSLFREVNERIEDLAGTAMFATFVCECFLEQCDQSVSLTLEEYEHIRSSSNLFFVLRGHELPELEDVVETTERYVLVRKIGVGAAVAERLDPRMREARHVERA